MKYLLTALLILSAGTAGAASGNLGADGNTQLPKITIIGITNQGPRVYSRAVNYDSVIRGVPSTILYSSFTAETTLSITGIDTAKAKEYRLTMYGIQNTQAGELTLTINSDGGNNYGDVNIGNNLAGIGLIYNGGEAAVGNWPLVACNHSDLTSYTASYFWADHKIMANGNNVSILGRSIYNNGQTGIGTSLNFCSSMGMSYFGSAPMTAITITDSAGTMTGWLRIEAITQPMGF